MSTGRIPFLRQLSHQDADELLRQARRRTFPPRTTILQGGAAADDVLLVLEGRVRLVAYGADEREVVLAIRGPGELVGEMASLGADRRVASAIALDEVQAGILSGDEFRDFLREHPDVTLVVIRMLVRRLAEATRDLIDQATQDSLGRVAKRLLELADDLGTPTGVGGTVELSLTQDELARWTGATRETVSRSLRLMRQLGWVSTDQRKITVLDTAALRERSGGAAS